jgi:hypothetical protein
VAAYDRTAFDKRNSNRSVLEQKHEIGLLRETLGNFPEFDEVIALDPNGVTEYARRDTFRLLGE